MIYSKYLTILEKLFAPNNFSMVYYKKLTVY